MRRVTPERITDIGHNEVFVFGSNIAGIHGAGAALIAYNRFGARWGRGLGEFGATFAIPTKNAYLKTLKLNIVKVFVEYFIKEATENKDKIYLVTEIGCGLAGYKPKEIAPLFRDAVNVGNIFLPQSFWNVLENKEY